MATALVSEPDAFTAPASPPGLGHVATDAPVRPIGALSRALVVLVVLVSAVPFVRFLQAWIGYPMDLAFHPGDAWHQMLFFALVTLLLWGHVIVALVWMHRARTNALRMRSSNDWGPGWAVGAWLVPYGFVVLGYLVMREIWRGTSGRDPPRWLLVGWLIWVIPQVVISVWAWFDGTAHLLWPGAPLAVSNSPLHAELVPLYWAICQGAAAIFFCRFVLEVGSQQHVPAGSRAWTGAAAGSNP